MLEHCCYVAPHKKPWACSGVFVHAHQLATGPLMGLRCTTRNCAFSSGAQDTNVSCKWCHLSSHGSKWRNKLCQRGIYCTMASAWVFHHMYYNMDFGFFFLWVFYLSLETYMRRLGQAQAGVTAPTTLPDTQNLCTQLLLWGTAQFCPVAMPGLQSPPKHSTFLASSSTPNKHICWSWPAHVLWTTEN